MSKARPRSTKKSTQNTDLPLPSSSIPQAPVFYPTEAEFQDPLAYISQIRPQAERFGICRIVPPKSWAPPFALDRSNFTFPTKSQSIHQLQARAPSCDSKTFNLEYGRFLEKELGKKAKKKAVFEGAELDLCKMFYAVKRFGGYEKVCEGKKWGEVLRFVRPEVKISECGKHVLCQLYREYLFEYEEYQGKTSKRERQENESDEKLVSKKRKKSGMSEDKVKEEVKEDLDQICEQCKSGLHGEVMLLCDRCDKGWHLYCLTPPLESVPSGNWYCLECVNSEKDSFGFVPGKTYSLEAFRRRDERAKRKWLGQTCVTRAQIEKKFWEIVEGKAGDVEVMYGSDLDTSIHGSGFPRCGDVVPSSIDLDLWNEYCSNPWNLNNLPKLQGSMLKAVHDNIAGVMVPWLYIGMLFSSFCWHVEDHCFYSINYLHWGEPKCWYGVPGIEAGAFEQVMRDNLPDLFDAQPDLLFQLVTMLNPSVLQENGVSVYNVMQEPGNFVVTFPKSFHGGFNFGLNCAEAVNFAPADWFPHGGFGAEWYRLYHKAQVLSHEELLCVVSQSGCDAKAVPYLKDEMHRIYVREKKCREELWRCGIVRSSRMPPRKQPMYVGTEEDPTCVICQQYLYLSAITCTCRPSAFVCLEHWQHLCECKPSQLRLLYRQTLAELYDLVHLETEISEATSTAESQCCINSQRRFHYKVTDMTRKVKGDLISYTQLAEDWLSKACHLIEVPFSKIAYKKSLQEAEQFLWASHDMDLVREMANKLMDAQQWAIKLRNVLSKVEECLLHKSNDANKVSLCSIEELLVDPLPCNEPRHVKLKAFAEDARTLVCEIKSVPESIDLDMLERLYYRTVEFPIKLKESVELETEISSAKSWITDASKCLSKEKPTVDIDFLNRVKLKMAELRVQLPYMDAITNLCHEVDLWQSQCEAFLKRPIKIKELEDFLGSADSISITIPEMELLKQYYFDAYTWICNVKNTMLNLKKREDHHNVVEELKSILDSGNLLRVQVNELPVIEAELSRFRCREKALKALSTHEPLDILEQLLVEASAFEIQNEQLFLEVHRVIAAAKSWEEKAKSLLETAAPRSVYEEVLRSSENIPTYLPSLSDIKNALTQAQAWISKSEPYLTATPDSLHHLLNMDDLKELVIQSEHLKVTVDGTQKLKCILNDVSRWDDCANSLLEQSKALLYMHSSDIIIDNLLSVEVTKLLNKIGSAIERGLAFCLQLNQIPELEHASLILKWSLKALSFCSEIPLYEEVVSLLKDANNLPNTFLHNTLTEALNMGLVWLQKAMSMFPVSQDSKRCKQEDIEEILEESKKAVISYPKLVAQLETAIVNHESWAREVNSFFSKCSGQSWASLKKLKELGQTVAFDCNELDKILYEIEKVDKWMILCHQTLEPSICVVGSLCIELAKIKGSLDKALCIYRGSSGFKRSFCVCCPNDSEDDSYICLTCEDRYHFSCMGPPLAAAGMTNEYACPFCLCMESGAISGPTGNALISRGKRPEIKSFVQLLSSRKDCYEDFEEASFVQDIVKIALECKSCLTEIVNHALVHSEKDLSYVSESLLRALKAVAVMRVYDVEDGCFLESAVSKNSWKIRVKSLLEDSKKPSLSLIHRLLKEGISIGIPSTDHYMKEIMEVKQISLLWLETAKKAIAESEALELHDVFKLISDGEALPVLFEKEIELLRDRSILYCICRKPYDHRAMIACDQCDEWYHFDCIKLDLPTPDKFLCAACKPSDGEFVALPVSFHHEERRSNDGEPHTPPACHKESNRRQPKKAKYSLDQKMDTEVLDLRSILKCYSGIDLLWRGNRRPLKRTVRKLTKFEKLSQFLHLPQSH